MTLVVWFLEIKFFTNQNELLAQQLGFTITHLKKQILVQNQGGAEFQPADILQYFEELKGGPNADIGQKNLFEVGSSNSWGKFIQNKERHMTDKKSVFEQGPIRPPNEARSLLLRVTRNCPWNQCLFCPVYKRQKFSLRSVDEIKEDIQAVWMPGKARTEPFVQWKVDFENARRAGTTEDAEADNYRRML